MGAYGGNLGFPRAFTADPIGVLALRQDDEFEG
jgi:hypothetical protein